MDGLVILPSLRGVKVNPYSIAVSANALRSFLGVAAAEDDKTLYMPHAINYGNVGTIIVNSNYDVNNVSGNLVIQNCSIGYNDTTNTANGVASVFFMGAMNGCYLLQKNDFYNNLQLQNASVAGSVNKIVNNNLTYCSISINVSPQDSLPVIRDNAITANSNKIYGSVPSSNAWNYASILTVSNNCAYQYTAGERAVIGLSTTEKSGKYVLASYHNNTNGYMVFLSRASATAYADTTMDSQEELGYYLGKEGDVTLTQNFEITKAGVLPEKILATVNYGDYKITKADGLELPAPDGYKWNGNTLEKAAWIATALLLQNDLNMKFYVAADRVANGEYLVVTMNGNEVTLSDWQVGTGANAGKKFVTFEGIAATRMATEVSVQLYDAEGNAIAGCDHVDSIRMYAERLKAAYGDNVRYKNLMNALLAYGAAAQYAEKADVPEENLANYGWSWN